MTDLALDLADRAARVLPGGSTHAARTYRPPLYVVRASGSHKWLVDGRELVDYTMGHGALLLGHAHPAVVAAVCAQVERGTHYGAGHPLEVEWAERICSLVESVDEVRFTASGTEAAMLALRVARVATGRDVVVKLDEHFHGWSDAVSVNLDGGVPRLDPGVPAVQLQATRVIRSGDVEALRAALSPGDVAAVIFEGSGAHYGRVPMPDGYASALREECDHAGTLLVIDEVVTGFRVDPGGMQSVLGIRPDLSIFGKVMAGGLPGGAVGGRRDLMELLAGTIAHPGTFNANPLTASAGITTLELCADGRPQQVAADAARRLEEGWREVMARRGVDGTVRRLASILHIELADAARQETLAARLRERGVDLLHTSAFCSAVHSDDDIAVTVDALDQVLRSSPA
ncbi:MAG TPA: aminotransferase class III-fold pyridoxal phosphate-dependent enzyme [Candidatus Dormibacteraeota bacterium]|nr:aminotransferase class III-fold pyridoxal phosphate-dependent enzyme [Candidatus Dormibacteraeota bacterium]